MAGGAEHQGSAGGSRTGLTGATPQRRSSGARISIETLCRDALDGRDLSIPELQTLLEARGAQAEIVYAAARRARARHFDTIVFLYGFVYFSTHCRNGCTFCLYRAGNPAGPRYRKTTEEVVAVCRELAASGVALVDLTMGEDPLVHVASGYSDLVHLVRAVSEDVALPIMVSPGLVPDDVLEALGRYGADWYALYQETHTPGLFERLRPGQSFAARAHARRAAWRAGLLVEDGILTGVGDTSFDRATSIAVMRRAGCAQVRVMSLVPQEGTPLGVCARPNDEAELLSIAVMRLAMQDRLIPASLDVEGIDGLERRLQAGANVVTSIVPPGSGFLGVSNAELGIEEGERTVAAVVPRLEALGLRAGTPAEYRDLLTTLPASGSCVAS